MKVLHMVTAVILLLLIIVAGSAMYTVREGQQAILLKLGKLVLDSDTQKPAVMGPGLHLKMPFVEHQRLFDVRLRTSDTPQSRIVTAEQKDVLVDYFVKWRISNPALYFKRTSDNSREATRLLDQQVGDKLRAEFGRRTIAEAVSDDRLQIMQDLKTQVNENSKALGIEVADVRIKSIDLPDEVSRRVYDRMRATRKVVATEHRATGKAEAEAIRARAKSAAVIKLAGAREEGARTRAEGDAIAAKIYVNAYNKNEEFYAFYRSINAYKDIFANKKDILVLKPDNQFFKYFGDMQGKAHTSATG